MADYVTIVLNETVSSGTGDSAVRQGYLSYTMSATEIEDYTRVRFKELAVGDLVVNLFQDDTRTADIIMIQTDKAIGIQTMVYAATPVYGTEAEVVGACLLTQTEVSRLKLIIKTAATTVDLLYVEKKA